MPITYDPYNPTSYTPLETSDSDAMAQVLRSQWQDYLNYYQPIAQMLMDRTTYNNPAWATEQVNSAVGNVNRAYDANTGAQARQYSRYGVTATQGQQNTINRQNNLDRSTSVVDAANTIRLRIADRNRLIASGGVPNITSAAIRTSIGTGG